MNGGWKRGIPSNVEESKFAHFSKIDTFTANFSLHFLFGTEIHLYWNVNSKSMDGEVEEEKM